MTWKEIGPYRGHLLWVQEIPPGGWLVAMVPDCPPPEGARRRVRAEEDQVLPEAFPSEIAAAAAAMRFLDRQEERRNNARG